MKAFSLSPRGPAAFALVAATITSAGCATAAPYNPAHLQQADLDRVAGVCQSALGLKSGEPPTVGNDNPRLDPQENHYQGCIASLSDFARVPVAVRGPAVASAPVKGGSYYWTTTGEKARRIEAACAEMGLNPATGVTSSCVKDMKDTFYAIDTPWR